MSTCFHPRWARRVDPDTGPYKHCPDCGEDHDFPTPNVNLDSFHERIEGRA